MKKTIKVSVLLVIALVGLSATAQVGIKAGLGVSNWVLKDNDVDVSAELFDAGFAFSTGVGFEIDFSDNIALEPALLFTQKSFSADLDEFFKVKTNFIELPVNLKVYILDLGDVGRLYGLGGGYVAYMFSGKSNDVKIDIGNKSTDFFKPLDGGINIGAGVQFFEALNVDFSGSIGVANLSNDRSNGLKSRLNVVRLSVTYQFGG
ncbi:PorT family protein [Flavobacteriaceae bacterium TP-CH-4]|uniref:PorT family protein n=1 Tax=Pelagihabitans pacificus TaxID=2696054 RepID=A0A967AQM0_9FLAO|nr:porin family protein [Pelagihabitans pacificus]NHF58559.1 PorT family protein [Pelagihabitans pacificus]